MSYDLKVIFHGMCLFVADTDELHVLLPATGGEEECGEAGCVELHAARLIFDTAHLRESSTAYDDVLASRSLQQKKLAFPDSGVTLDLTMPPELAVLGSPVCADVLDGTNTDLITARVSLLNGGWSDHSKGACWSWGGQVRRLSHVVEWTVAGVTGDSLALEVVALSGVGTTALPVLYPVDGVIELEVWHAPHCELPPDSVVPDPPSRGGAGHHFAAYGKLLESGVNDMPAYVPDACPEITNPGRFDEEGGRGSATYACMAAQAPPE